VGLLGHFDGLRHLANLVVEKAQEGGVAERIDMVIACLSNVLKKELANQVAMFWS
jgi:hypothetical protein